MLRWEDEEWLAESQPRLIPNGSGVEGTIAFRATFNAETGLFLILSEGVTDGVGGLPLCGEFSIRIEERGDKSLSALPALRVDGVEPISDRHFSQLDKTACLCSPFEEKEFLQPNFKFRPFIEQLVIPFLYGQLFYSLNRRWPWPDYSHGVVGLLESYAKCSDSIDPRECLRLLMMDGRAWPKLKLALLQKSSIKGHTTCFCPKADHIRRCHPDALRGIQRLQRELWALKTGLPQALKRGSR